MIPKTAVTAVPILEVLAERWSPRAFTPQLVEHEKLLALMEAFRWAPSSMNEQPWYLLVAAKDDAEGFAKMLGCLVDANQVWAKNAPLLMITLAKTTFNRNGNVNRTALHDTGIALMALFVQATALGMQAHGMGGIHLDKIREVYGLPADVEAVAGVAVGYAASAELLEEPMRSREMAPRTRKPLSEFVLGNSWGEVSKVLK